MAIQVQRFEVAIPTGSTPSAPQTFQMQIGIFSVSFIEVDIPDGPRGSVGFYIASSGKPVIPFTGGSPKFLVLNNTSKHWDLSDQPDSGDWQLIAYNVGGYSHTIGVDFGLELVGANGASVPLGAQMVPLSSLQ